MNFNNGEYYPKINGLTHWVKIEGSENATTPLIILHGGPGGNHYTFERTVGPLLSQNHTIIYYEQRGCGRSEKPSLETDYSIKLLIEDFIEIKKWLGVEKVDLLGYSFGGQLALEIAYTLPEGINNLVLSAPSLTSDIEKLIQLAGFMSVANRSFSEKIQDIGNEGLTIDELYDQVWGLADSKTVDLLLFENQEIAKKNRELWKEGNLTNTGLMMKALRKNPVEIPLRYRLHKIKQRTLIMTGVFDRNTGLPISKIINEELVTSKLVLFHNSAHFPDLEEPSHFVCTINDFLMSDHTG